MPDVPSEFAPAPLLATLLEHRVRFVLIGGMAAVAHGSPFPTEDIDITPEASVANLSRLSAALDALAARVRTESVPEGLPFTHDAESLAASDMLNLTTRYGDLDISITPSGTAGFADLITDARDTTAFGLVLPIASLADVVRSKQAANRPKDQRVLPVLREILASRFRHDVAAEVADGSETSSHEEGRTRSRSDLHH
jgi:hypothetical protein